MNASNNNEIRDHAFPSHVGRNLDLHNYLIIIINSYEWFVTC